MSVYLSVFQSVLVVGPILKTYPEGLPGVAENQEGKGDTC